MTLDFSGNLYTFGCSITAYKWPTWADILGQKFQHYENWGRGAAGNQFIFNSVIECTTRNQVSSNDTIIIMWSGIERIDYYQFNEWSHQHRSLLDASDKDPISCPTGFEILNYAYFAAIERWLDTLGVNYHMLSWTPYDTDGPAGELYHKTLKKIHHVDYTFTPRELAQTASHNLIDLYDRLSGSSWPAFDQVFDYDPANYSREINQEVDEFKKIVKKNKHLYYTNPSGVDLHPLPNEHLNMLYNTFDNIVLDSTAVDTINRISDDIVNSRPYKFDKHLPVRL